MTGLRCWLAGLLTHLGLLAEHAATGLDALADHVAPDDPDLADAPTLHVAGDHRHLIPADVIEHDPDDDCPCGPSVRCEQTPRGDIWHVTHHPLTQETR